MNYFSAKIKFLHQTESGEIKRKSEEFLVSASTFIEAETNLLENLKDEIAEYQLTALSIKTFDDIFKSEYELGERLFFKVVIALTTLDPDTSKESKVKSNSLIQAESTDEATKKIKEIWSHSVSDWEIISISQTKYVDVFI